MAKKVVKLVKLQVPAGKATPAPPVGPALGQAGVNIMAFVKEFNERTAAQAGLIIPIEISVFEDRSFTFITKLLQQRYYLKKQLVSKQHLANLTRKKLLSCHVLKLVKLLKAKWKT